MLEYFKLTFEQPSLTKSYTLCEGYTSIQFCLVAQKAYSIVNEKFRGKTFQVLLR